MEQDSNDLVPRGDIPTEAELARLLCDRTFVDYFNVFLSLPVFSQRLLYKFSDQSFELDPPLKRTHYRVDRVKLMRWVRTKRAPFFFRCDLYLEFLLCKQLQKTQLHLVFSYGQDTASAKDKMMDHCLMTRWLRRVSGMRRFRRFISKTVGENSVQFWLDAERFRRTANEDEEKWAVFYRKIEAKYFTSRDVKLPGVAQVSQLQQYQSSVCSSTDSEMTSDKSTQQRMNRDSFIIVQGCVLKTLQNYWVPRYLIHCKKRFSKFTPTTTLRVYRPDCYAIKVRSLSEISTDDENESEKRGSKQSDHRSGSHHLIRKLQLKKQSVDNLMSMFSSAQVRRSELSTLLKVEDTGEMVRQGSSENAELGDDEGKVMTAKMQDWLTEEFPLLAISEENSNSRSQSVSPVKRTPSIPDSPTRSESSSSDLNPDSDGEGSHYQLTETASRNSQRSSRQSSARPCSSSPLPLPQTEEGQRAASQESGRKESPQRRSRKGSARRGSSRRGSSRKGSALTGDAQAIASEMGETPSEFADASSDESTDAAGEISESEQRETPASGRKESPSISPKAHKIDTTDTATDQKESGEMTYEKKETKAAKDKDDNRHRGNIAKLTKYRRNSDTSISFSRKSRSMSVGQSSVSSGPLASLSKRKMSVPSTGVCPPRIAKPPAKRRARSQSVEFRLGYFSHLLNKAEKENGNDCKTKSNSGSIKNPRLEVDLIALQSLQQDRNKRKNERTKKRRLMKKNAKAKQKKEAVSDVEFADLSELENSDDTLVNTQKKLAMRRKGTMTPLANINRTAFQKLEALYTMSLSEREKPEKRALNKSINLRTTNKQGLRKKYSELSFEEKLREDDRRLLPISNLAEALRGKMMPKRSEMLPAIGPQRPISLDVSRPRFTGYNLGESDYRGRNKMLVMAVLSDRLAGWPLMKFLARYSYTVELRYLSFWHTAQEYLDAGQQVQDARRDLLRQRLAVDLITNFLAARGERQIRLGRLLVAELTHQLPANTGDELLLHAQNLACEAVREVWAVFERHDVDGFLSITSERKNAQQRAYPLYTSPALKLAASRRVKLDTADEPSATSAPKTMSQVLAEARKGSRKDGDGDMVAAAKRQGDTANSLTPYRMMRAVELCSASALPGLTDTDLSDPSDPDEESDDEGSLCRKNIIVLRKRKIKNLPKPITKRATQQSRSHGSETQTASDRDEKAAKTGICWVIEKDGKTIHRPRRPRSFMEVLHDTSHFEFFRRFLQVEIGNELPLSLWQSIEQLRMSDTVDPKVWQAKAQAIVKKYFNKTTNFGADLDTDADIIRDIPTMKEITPQMLMSAQTCVAKSMEDKWYDDYKESYSDEGASEAPKKVGQEGHTRYLWNIFITNVCQFRRGLMTPWLLSMFKDYLGKEVLRAVEKQRVSGVVSQKFIGGKIVIVNKLQNDLCFWVEAERFKQLTDNAARGAAAGTYTPEDEKCVRQKADAIINVFLDSFASPRVQINVPQEIVQEIIDVAQHGIIARGLFHDAAIHTFTVLFYCWKKFTKERLGYKSASMTPKPVEHLAPPLKKKPKKKKKASTPRVCGVKIKTLVGASSDDHPRMFFTIENGVLQIIPPKPQPEHESEDRYRTLVRNSGHEESLMQLFQQPAALGLGLAQQR